MLDKARRRFRRDDLDALMNIESMNSRIPIATEAIDTVLVYHIERFVRHFVAAMRIDTSYTIHHRETHLQA